MRNQLLYLQDILAAIERIEEFVGSMSFNAERESRAETNKNPPSIPLYKVGRNDPPLLQRGVRGDLLPSPISPFSASLR